jgi:hypothetical protein
MMGRQAGGQKKLFYSFNLDDHVPADHQLRGVDQLLDEYLADRSGGAVQASLVIFLSFTLFLVALLRRRAAPS